MRRLLGISLMVCALAAPAAPALADDNPCKGEAPGPHCRPMDCEIVWDPTLSIDPIPFPGVPRYKCYT